MSFSSIWIHCYRLRRYARSHRKHVDIIMEFSQEISKVFCCISILGQTGELNFNETFEYIWSPSDDFQSQIKKNVLVIQKSSNHSKLNISIVASWGRRDTFITTRKNNQSRRWFTFALLWEKIFRMNYSLKFSFLILWIFDSFTCFFGNNNKISIWLITSMNHSRDIIFRY